MLTGCIGAPPSPEAIAGEFATAIQPAWETETPGMFGEPVIRDGVVLAYSIDDEVGMLLSAYGLDDGELLWQHTASPGGAYANPILAGVDSASRPYPLSTIVPLVVETGEDATPAVVFFERDVESDSLVPDDFLRVADLASGELLEVTLPDFDPEAFTFEPLGITDGGDVFANTYTPGYRCGGGSICWVSTDAELSEGYGEIVLDPATLEARYSGGLLPEPTDDANLSVEWGYEYIRVVDDGFGVARFVDGEELWRVPVKDLFEVGRTSPPDYVPFVEVGDLVLVQGYQPIIETLDPTCPTRSRSTSRNPAPSWRSIARAARSRGACPAATCCVTPCASVPSRPTLRPSRSASPAEATSSTTSRRRR